MRFSIIAAVAAFSSTVVAQSLSQIPKCAQTCFGNNLGSCGPVDIGCICGNTAVINSVSCCVFATCSQSDIQTTINFAVNLCKLNNVNVNTSPSCPTNGTASTSAVSVSSTASVSLTASASSTASATGLTGSQSPTAGQASSAGAPVPLQTAGALGMAMAGLIAFL